MSGSSLVLSAICPQCSGVDLGFSHSLELQLLSATHILAKLESICHNGINEHSPQFPLGGYFHD